VKPLSDKGWKTQTDQTPLITAAVTTAILIEVLAFLTWRVLGG